MIERMVVADAKAAAMLGRMRPRHIVLALIEQERTQSALAAILGIGLNLLRHHLDRLVAARLIEVTRSEARRGRPIRHYRATAREYFVPAELAPAEPNRPMMEELRQVLERSRAAGYDGMLYHWDDGPRMRIVRDSARGRPAAELWHRMRLTPADAQALIAELRTLFARYESHDAGTGDTFIMLGAIAPL